MADELLTKKVRLDAETALVFHNFDLESFQKKALYSRLQAYKELCSLLENEKSDILNRALPEGMSNF